MSREGMTQLTTGGISQTTLPKLRRRAFLAGGTALAAGYTIFQASDAGAQPPPADISGWPVINITAAPFNADPTGKTDSTAAILAAIAASGSAGVIYAPAGIYLITGGANGGHPITFSGTVQLIGEGGRASDAGTTFLCGDVAAGLVLNGSALYQGFLIHGDNVATLPLQRGLSTGGGAYGVFKDVWVTNSAQDGWTIIGSQNDAYYSCGSDSSARDNLYIDGGAGGLDFYHWEEANSGRYGLHADALVSGRAGSYGSFTEDVHFWGGIFDAVTGGAACVSKIYLRHATDYAFPKANLVGMACSGPTVDIDQSSCFGIDFDGAYIWAAASGKGTSPGHACIQISGTSTAPQIVSVRTDGVYFVAGDTSVYVATAAANITAANWLADLTSNGPVAASGLPGIDTMLKGRTGEWQIPANASGWSGAVAYRVGSSGRIEFKGTVEGPSGSTAFTLSLGYRPPAIAYLSVITPNGFGVAAVEPSGAVVVAEINGTTTKGVYFDGLSLPTT
jgi:hypothetical protein